MPDGLPCLTSFLTTILSSIFFRVNSKFLWRIHQTGLHWMPSMSSPLMKPCPWPHLWLGHHLGLLMATIFQACFPQALPRIFNHIETCVVSLCPSSLLASCYSQNSQLFSLNGEVVNCVDSGANPSGFEIWLHRLLAVWLWEGALLLWPLIYSFVK